MATNQLTCANNNLTPSALLMNDVPANSSLIRQSRTLSNLMTTIQSRNNTSKTNLLGDVYSSSNYIQIKRIALEQNLVTPPEPGSLLGGSCRIAPITPLLGDAIPALSNLPNEINKILAGNK
jgi:hypothetical protein